uniref:DUF2415 domain-containing protein n=1 Tax=Hanusia phi TaxID=3032 RepID=A0A7S0EYQ1_9CRYP|mmetsp:Transcript_34492/g.77781  ORF Transcript_34492/g.77781 Transcript_34492/m.77781 type:complete len:443 (+) Transcript_34492:33-1361(+)
MLSDNEYFFDEEDALVSLWPDNSIDRFDSNGLSRVTKDQFRRGCDPQGIRWDQMDISRSYYRQLRLEEYDNYVNLDEETRPRPHSSLKAEIDSHITNRGHSFYEFENSEKQARANIVHFQLRNLVWATTSHDVFVTQAEDIQHFSYMTNKLTPILTRFEHSKVKFSLDALHMSTMCVQGNICIAGGFFGDLVCVKLPSDIDYDDATSASTAKSGEVLYSAKITSDENAITNSILLQESKRGVLEAVITNNDSAVRILDVDNSFREVNRMHFPWPVNYATLSPDRNLICVLGDSTECVLMDVTTSQRVAVCDKHLDYSFAAAWHPDGNIFATGNQDKTARLWDRRMMKCLATLGGHLGAIRSIRFTQDGRYMAMAEPADFVHIFDVKSNWENVQEIDIFGEIAGISFSPDDDALFVGISDRIYGTMMQYRRKLNGLYDYDLLP